MPRPRYAGGFTDGSCKIRKRGTSSSSSSSVLQNCRLKRAVFVGRRCESSTPASAWKTEATSPSSISGVSEVSQQPPSHGGSNVKQAPVSARKLANALWALNKMPSPVVSDDLQGRRCREEKGRRRSAGSVRRGALPPHLSDPSHNSVSDMMDRSGSSGHRRRSPLPIQKSRFSNCRSWALDSPSVDSLMEIGSRSQGLSPSSSWERARTHFKDLSNGLNTSVELVKMLSHVCRREEKHLSSMSILSALCTELDKASVHVNWLFEEQKSERKVINYLKRQLSEEKFVWRRQQQEKIDTALQSILEELELERELRRKEERINKKLGIELDETKNALLKSSRELDSEIKSREVIERVCGELVKGIGEEKAEVEEIKRESMKVREELEREREMLQLADIWREERVQMKLSDAKFQLEEKNAAVDQLRNELESFLSDKRSGEDLAGYQNYSVEMMTESHGQRIDQNVSCAKSADDEDLDGNEDCAEGDGEEDSVDSDLHSIELNMDNNCKGYKWSFALPQEANLNSAGEDCDKGGSENFPRKSFSSHGSGASGGNQWMGLDFRKLMRNSKHVAEKHHRKLDPDAERYKSVKGLREQMLAAAKAAPARAIASPTRLWGHPQSTQGSSERRRNSESKVLLEMLKTVEASRSSV